MYNSLTPYKSVLLLVSNERAAVPSATQFRDALWTTLESTHTTGLRLRNRPHASRARGIDAAALHYEESAKSPWSTDDDIVDVVQQLILVIVYRGFVAVFASDNAVKSLVRSRVEAAAEDPYRQVRLVQPATLNAALLRSRATQTLWMSGTHRRVASKVDNKILSGSDLRFALEPLGDQSFFFTAARARGPVGGSPATVGVAPRKSSVWMGLSNSWDDFADSIKNLVAHIDGCTESSESPFPILATPSTTPLANLGEVYDATFVPPESLDETQQPDDVPLAEKWAEAALEASPVRGHPGRLKITASLPQGDRLIGIGAIEIQLTIKHDAVQWSIAAVAPLHGQDQDFAEFQKILTRRPGWLKLWFESGHILADRHVFRTRHRDLPFPEDRWRWESFDGFNVAKEKPTTLAAANIGASDSLFCWVRKHWQPEHRAGRYSGGWLACNDGSMEIADFIHLDVEQPTLTLIHVKGAKHESPNRNVAVAPYEVVVGQAIKNIRQLDHEIISELFNVSLDRRITDAVWHNRRIGARATMLEKLRNIGPAVARRVVVLQPHVRRTALAQSRAAGASERLKQTARQLDTLLHAARASCQAVGAEFTVIGQA